MPSLLPPYLLKVFCHRLSTTQRARSLFPLLFSVLNSRFSFRSTCFSTTVPSSGINIRSASFCACFRLKFPLFSAARGRLRSSPSSVYVVFDRHAVLVSLTVHLPHLVSASRIWKGLFKCCVCHILYSNFGDIRRHIYLDSLTRTLLWSVSNCFHYLLQFILCFLFRPL